MKSSDVLIFDQTEVGAMTDGAKLPALAADAALLARIKSEINLSDRAQIVSFGEAAQRSVTQFAERMLAQTQNKALGDTGKLLSDILAKARGLDAASIGQGNFVTRLFSSAERRIRRFAEQFENVAAQVDRIVIDLDRHKENLRRDIAMLDELHGQTQQAIIALDTHIEAGKAVAAEFRAGTLADLKRDADAKSAGGEGLLAAQAYQDAAQAIDRLEKRVFYLQQARQIGIQQLPQIRIVQSSDETLIENLQATSELTIPVWKQKMVLLLGLNRQRSALELQKAVTEATNEMMRQASEMMKSQAVDIERQSRRGIIDIQTLEATNRDLIDTISGVLKVQSEGRQKRAEIERKMTELNGSLKKAMSQVPQ
jgi:uncharacterized protein YaaN involved in tellurite resistance